MQNRTKHLLTMDIGQIAATVGTVLLRLWFMDEPQLPVTYKNVDYDFPLRIVPRGFVYHFAVQVGDAEVIFERDDEGSLRAIIYNQDVMPGKLPEAGLLEAIINVLEQLQ